MRNRMTVTSLALAGLVAAPLMAFGQATPQTREGTPADPPGTAAGRAMDRAAGTNQTGTNPQAQVPPAAEPRAAAPGETARAARAATDSRRASRIIGSNVYNDRGESVGSVDDLLIARDGGTPTAVLSVGGFLGIGARLVTVPLGDLQWSAQQDRWVLPGATKEALQNRPAFNYDSASRG